MRQFLTLLKLEFMNRAPKNRVKGHYFSKIIKYLIIILAIVAVGGGLLYVFNSLISICLQAELEQEFIVYYTALVQLVQLFFGLSLTTKTLFYNSDSDLLKLPVNGKMIFLAKLTYLFIYEFIFTTFLTLPVFILYGIQTMQSAIFYVMLLPNIIFFPVIPFLLGVLLSIPAMYVVGYLKNKFIVMLVLYTLCVALGFTIYTYGLRFIMEILSTSDISSILQTQVVLDIKFVANILYTPLLFKNSLLLYRFWPSAIVNLTIAIALFLIVVFFANKSYLKILLSNAENGGKVFHNKAQIKERSVNKALFFREFLSIFRSTNYAFQYLTIVITTPLMVFFSSQIASSIGVDQVGEGILPGIVVLVLLMFLSMGTSFAATSITREGGNFFHTKIIPVTYRKQVTVKFLMYLIVSIPSVIISALVLAFAGFLSYFNAMMIALAVCMIVTGSIASSILLDIKKPQFMFLDGKEITTTNSNVNASITLGFIIAVLMGIGSIVVSMFVSVPAIYIVLFGFGLPYMAVEVFRLFFRLEKRYRSIEA